MTKKDLSGLDEIEAWLWIKMFVKKEDIQGGFFDCSALKMTKCQPLKEISELFLPKND